MSASEASSVTLSDYESTSSLEIVVDTKKLREELAREAREERRIASEEKENNKNGKGKKPMSRLQRIDREMKKRRMMKAQVMKNMHKHLQMPYVRKAYDYFRREIPDQTDEFSAELIRNRVRVSADENHLTITIFSRPPEP